MHRSALWLVERTQWLKQWNHNPFWTQVLVPIKQMWEVSNWSIVLCNLPRVSSNMAWISLVLLWSNLRPASLLKCNVSRTRTSSRRRVSLAQAHMMVPARLRHSGLRSSSSIWNSQTGSRFHGINKLTHLLSRHIISFSVTRKKMVS